MTPGYNDTTDIIDTCSKDNVKIDTFNHYKKNLLRCQVEILLTFNDAGRDYTSEAVVILLKKISSQQ
jgi:hypothetical protein